MSTASAKQQVIQKIKENTNILVTVSRDPSVDELVSISGTSTILDKPLIIILPASSSCNISSFEEIFTLLSSTKTSTLS